MFDLQTPFFIPLSRRIAVTAVCAFWGAFEFVTANPFWGVLFWGLALYCAWQFFFDGWPNDDDVS